MNGRSALVLALLAVGATQSASAQDPVKLSPRMYTVLLENDHVRVLEFRARPGESEPMHAHPAATFYDISGGRFKITTPDGKSETRESKAGSAGWSATTTHQYQNVGSTDVHVIVVETKSTKPEPSAPAKPPNR